MTFASHALIASLFAGLGAVAGYLHLKLLAWNIRALVSHAHAAAAIAAPSARIASTIAVFVLSASQGALALTAALAGFLIARTMIVRRPGSFFP